MNKLVPLGEGRWRLAPHARLIVYETDDGNEFLTVYDCGAAQAPPRAQVIGNLVRVGAAHVLERQPTGYAVTLREEGVLVRQDPDHFVVRARDAAEPPADA